MKNPLTLDIYTKRTKAYEEDVRGSFFRDQTAIIHSTAFRRMKHKTQVFYAPKNDHICTRIEHVMHVATIAKSICKGLNYNGWNLDVEMSFAIGLGHDLGHAPFGHDGESILNKLVGDDFSFIHEIQSYRVVEYLANNGNGLNLTYGVKDGIITHNGEKFEQKLKPQSIPNELDKIVNRRVIPSSYEGCIVRFSDKIAYLGRDIEDAIMAKVIKESQIPDDVKNKIGTTNSKIIDAFVNDIINTSKNTDFISFSDEKYDLILQIRDFNYKYIYLNDKEKIFPNAQKMLSQIFIFLGEIYEKFKNDFEKYSNSNLSIIRHFGSYLESMYHFYGDNTDTRLILADYISGMTDYYAIKAIKQITIPKSII